MTWVTENAIRSACQRRIDQASHHLAQPNVPQSLDRYKVETDLAHLILDILAARTTDTPTEAQIDDRSGDAMTTQPGQPTDVPESDVYDYMRGYSKGRRDALREAADDAQLSLFYNSDTVARWLRARAVAEAGE